MNFLKYIILFLLSFSFLYSQNYPFKLKEKLVFEVNGVIKEWRLKGTLGTLELEIVDVYKNNNRIIYQCVGIASTSPLVKSRYDLRDIQYSWFDGGNFQVYKIEKFIKEDKWTNHIIMNINPKTKSVIQYDRFNPDGKTYSFPPNAYDILTFIYFLRKANKTQNLTFTLFDSEFTKDITLSFKSIPDEKVAILDSKNKIKLIQGKENTMYGISVKFAKDHDFIPVAMDAVTINVPKVNITITAQMKLVKYIPGNEIKESDIKKWQ